MKMRIFNKWMKKMMIKKVKRMVPCNKISRIKFKKNNLKKIGSIRSKLRNIIQLMEEKM